MERRLVQATGTAVPIPTKYAGVQFRSRLEARWAEFFDEQRLSWVYEEEGYELDGSVWYLPDFYLPRARAFVEVKGAFDRIEKTFALARAAYRANIQVFVGASPAGEAMCIIAPDPHSFHEKYPEWFGVHEFGPAALLKCQQCGLRYLIDPDQHWGCRGGCPYSDNAEIAFLRTFEELRVSE